MSAPTRADSEHQRPGLSFAGIFAVTFLGLIAVGSVLPVLPRYVRGHIGTVALVHGCHVFPDSQAHWRGEDPQWLYTVRFAARELWGADADPTVAVSVDAFEPYLDPAP